MGPTAGVPEPLLKVGLLRGQEGNHRERSYQLTLCQFTQLQELSQAWGLKFKLALMKGTSRESKRESQVTVTTGVVTGN